MSQKVQPFLVEMDVSLFTILHNRHPHVSCLSLEHFKYIYSPVNIRLFYSVSRSIEAVIMSNHDINESFLRVWYTGQVLVAALAVSALEIVLMARGEYLSSIFERYRHVY